MVRTSVSITPLKCFERGVSKIMDTITVRLTPQSAFGTPPMGDSLFGQLCWGIRNRHSEARLKELLDDYLDRRPFLVVSDALPAGYVPRPRIPLSRLGRIEPDQRKTLKGRRWLPIDSLDDPRGWLDNAVALEDSEVFPQPHNSINRQTGTTGRGGFAPYVMLQTWYRPGVELDCRILFDSARISADEIMALFADMGATGFGRDASIGLGRFEARAVEGPWPASPPDAIAWLTLAPCAPQGLQLDANRSYYEVFTRFGRHGDMAVHQGNPFKAPILLARAGAVLAPSRFEPLQFIGQGLGGDGRLSRALPETVHQGYAPVVGIALPETESSR